MPMRYGEQRLLNRSLPRYPHATFIAKSLPFLPCFSTMFPLYGNHLLYPKSRVLAKLNYIPKYFVGYFVIDSPNFQLTTTRLLINNCKVTIP